MSRIQRAGAGLSLVSLLMPSVEWFLALWLPGMFLIGFGFWEGR